MSFALTDAAALQAQVRGRVLTPDAPDYATARLTWNRTTDHYPAVILVAEDAGDVSAGIQFAREAGLGVAIQSTGHGIQQPADDALLIITSRMNAVTVDAAARTAHIGAGAVWQHVLDQAVPHGLAPLLGSSPNVGVAGYTLGGGIGWLARRYGFASDSVRSIEVVTPDAVLRQASPTENSDLFWALRGGGGNFGVVTALTMNLYPVAALYGGSLYYPGEQAAEALRFFRDWTRTVPDELTSSITIMKYPTLPQLPEALRGRIEVEVKAAYVGEESARWMQPWLDWQPPARNTLRQLPFAEIATISHDPVEPMAGYGSNELLDDLPDEAISVFVQHATRPDSPLAAMELRHGGGAIARNDPTSSAISSRDAQFYWQMAGPAFTPEAYAGVKGAIAEVKQAMRPYLRGNIYLNFMKGDESGPRTRDAYSPENFARLVALKSRYDPENLFRFSYQLV